jgi:multisubunit Na+/H+ antiporter MnhG subunit
MNWREIVATILIILGGSLELLAVLGVCVMRNVYDRLHYVGLVSFGGLLIGVAIVFREGFSLIGDEALLTAAILMTSGPILVQTTMRSFLIRERKEWQNVIPEAAEDDQP